MPNPPVGIFIVNKPTGLTSHDVVNKIRKLTGEKCVGHGGTLDPLATGVLIILVGKAATRLTPKIQHQEKHYRITFALGYATDSLDSDGQRTIALELTDPKLKLTDNQITTVIESMRGTYEQEVPIFSAIKIDGHKLYELGRKNRRESAIKAPLTLPRRQVTIFDIRLVDISRLPDSYPIIVIDVHVSGGTYTRSLVRDIGAKLNLPATQNALHRQAIGNITDTMAIALDKLSLTDLHATYDFLELAGDLAQTWQNPYN